MNALITEDLVRLDVDLGTEKYDVIGQLAGVVEAAGRTSDVAQLTADAHAREDTAPTGLPGGIAIPHCRTAGVSEPTLAFARLNPPVEFGAKDGPADIAFLIAAPDGGDATHLQLLTKLARALVRKDFTDGLRAAETPAAVVALVNEAVGEPPAAKPAAVPTPAADAEAEAPAAAPADKGGPLSIVAVTACAAGIAHTYMAAEALETAAAKAGVEMHVETQGSAGSTPLDPALISNADAVIFACDVGVRDRHRFAGKPMVSSGVKRPIEEGDEMIAEAIRYASDPANSPKVEGEASEASAGGAAADESWGSRVRRVLMTGVSYMIPFVAAGGLLIALGFLLGGYDITGVASQILSTSTLFNPPDISAITLDDGSTFALEHALFGSSVMAYLGALLFTLGATAFGFLVPALAGYIAYAMADRPGIAPGFVMGAIALTINAGFLGGIVGGALAGMIAHWIANWRVPSWARGLMPVLVIPLLTTMIAGFVMIVVLGKPLSALMVGLTNALNNMQGGSAIILGAILGLMMAFDMGGPLNKTAYAFATTGLGTAAAAAGNAPELQVMAAVMLAGMVPPLALALATVIRPGLFTVPERENGKAAWLMGASFITEGAIPFAAADPLRIIPPIMVGSAVTGGISMAMEVGLRAPHGGIFVIFAVINILGFLIALAVGTVVAAAGVVLLKSLKKPEPATV